MAAAYDHLGLDYANLRKPDPRIAAQIWAALGDAASVINVGAGTGSYEPPDRTVTAIEPSTEMIRQRAADAAPVFQGHAEALPFADNSFDAAMASLTVHHWSDQAKGLAELRRVARGPVVILTYDPDFRGFWLLDYFPELASLDDKRMPPLSFYGQCLGPVKISPVPIPHDCSDGFLAAYWRRPTAYLDPRIRKGMSSFHLIGDISEGLERLERDLELGEWERRYGAVMGEGAMDLGYRLVVAQ
jgi:SAM-dependent methyltransferase